MVCHLHGIPTTPVLSLLAVFPSSQSVFLERMWGKNHPKKQTHAELGKPEAKELRYLCHNTKFQTPGYPTEHWAIL